MTTILNYTTKRFHVSVFQLETPKLYPYLSLSQPRITLTLSRKQPSGSRLPRFFKMIELGNAGRISDLTHTYFSVSMGSRRIILMIRWSHKRRSCQTIPSVWTLSLPFGLTIHIIKRKGKNTLAVEGGKNSGAITLRTPSSVVMRFLSSIERWLNKETKKPMTGSDPL